MGRRETYDSVEPRALIPLRLAVDLGFAGAKLAEVLGGAWDEVLVELEGDAAEGLACGRGREGKRSVR